MDHFSLFRMPTPMKITGRSSSITNAFINSIIPIIIPTNEQVKEALKILGMDLESFQCSYCGATVSEWDHLRPLVIDKKPTGYVSEIHNLVPSCGKCNQSKGNKNWHKWILSDAKLSPKSKGVNDLSQRIKKLKLYEEWGNPTIVDFESIVGKEKWKQHWDNWKKIQLEMEQAQILATDIKEQVAEGFRKD